MPWIEYALPVRPNPERAPTSTADALQRNIWENWARNHMGNRLRAPAYRATVSGGYLHSQATGGFATQGAGRWGYSDGALRFRFWDGDGKYRSHALAAAHWTEVSITTMLEEDHFAGTMSRAGWVLEPNRSATEALSVTVAPLLVLRGVLYALGPLASKRGAPELIADPRLPAVAWADLTAAERALASDAAAEGRCACQLCEYYRPRVAKLVAKRASKSASKAAVKSGSKAAAKAAGKSASKSAASKAAVKSGSKAAGKSASKSAASKAAVKSGSKAPGKGASKPAAKAAGKGASKPAAKAAGKGASKPAAKRVPKGAPKPAAPRSKR